MCVCAFDKDIIFKSQTSAIHEGGGIFVLCFIEFMKIPTYAHHQKCSAASYAACIAIYVCKSCCHIHLRQDLPANRNKMRILFQCNVFLVKKNINIYIKSGVYKYN